MPTNKCEFRDYTFIKENIPKLKPSIGDNGSIERPSESLAKLQYPLNPLIGEALEKGPRMYPSLYLFQKEAIDKITKNLNENPSRINAITARTAGGKTEAFMLPIIDYCIKNIDKIGTKAIFIYPTKALANDQANRTNSLLAYINEQLKRDGKRKITIGIYHGDITNKIYDYSIFRCPYCSNLLKHDEHGKLFCENRICGYLLDYKREYAADHILLTRNSIHVNPPDILITNPDMLNILLIERPESQAIFGRKKSLLKCGTCGEIVVTSKNRKKHSSLVKYGEKCPGMLCLVNTDFSSPKFIVIDEVHLMYGAFGAHLSYLLSRLTNVIRTYNESAKIVHIASSATIRNPKRFLSAMYGVQEDMIDIFPTPGDEKKYYDLEETDETIRRYHLFSMPNAYKTTMTVSFAYFKLLEYYKKKGLDFPNVLTFVNAIAAANSLISTTRQRVGQQFNVKIDGHSTEFDKKERARKEDDFNRNLINFLFATKTLEVGVDFDRINVLGLFGSPYSFNDFLQRIGRAGRKNNALVLTFFRSFNPVDNFYYSKCHEFLNYDISIRDKYMEDLPLSRDNPVISRKAVDQALFDYLCTRNDAHEYFKLNVRPFFEKTEKNPEGIYDFRKAILDEKFIEFIKNAVSPCPLTDKQIRSLVEKSINDYWGNLTGRETPLSWGLRNNFYGKKFLQAMRSSDPQIPVYIPSGHGGY